MSVKLGLFQVCHRRVFHSTQLAGFEANVPQVNVVETEQRITQGNRVFTWGIYSGLLIHKTKGRADFI